MSFIDYHLHGWYKMQGFWSRLNINSSSRYHKEMNYKNIQQFSISIKDCTVIHWYDVYNQADVLCSTLSFIYSTCLQFPQHRNGFAHTNIIVIEIHESSKSHNGYSPPDIMNKWYELLQVIWQHMVKRPENTWNKFCYRFSPFYVCFNQYWQLNSFFWCKMTKLNHVFLSKLRFCR